MNTEDITNPSLQILGRTLPYDSETGTFILKEDARTTRASASRGEYVVHVSVRDGTTLYELSGYGSSWRDAESAFTANYKRYVSNVRVLGG